MTCFTLLKNMNYLKWICSLVLFLCIPVKCENNTNLLAVVVVFRHGARSPIQFAKTDPYENDYYWEVGKGQLNSIGKRQHYELGQWFRERYNGFLPITYSEKDIYVRSTEYDRTYMSAMSNLAGLYPPFNYQKWNPDINWQPIPIHSVARDQDYLLLTQKPCKQYDALMTEWLNSKYVSNIKASLKNMTDFLSEQTGDDTSNWETLTALHDTWFIENSIYKLQLPSYLKEYYPEFTLPISVLEFARFIITPELMLLKTGPFFYELTQHFLKFPEQAGTLANPWGRKFTMLSAHDDIVLNDLVTMGVWDQSLPPYASTIIWELRLDENGDKYIQMLYKTSPTDVRRLVLPECDWKCDIQQFAALLRSKMLSKDQWEMACQNLPNDVPYNGR